MDRDSEIEKNLLPLLEGMGLSLVEMSIGRHRGDVKVNVVLYKKNGISLEDLTEAQKVLRPRLEIEFNRDNLSVEISSPGMIRVFKDPREYRIFDGRKIQVLVDDEWHSGRISGYIDDTLMLHVDGSEESIPIHKIRKAKLD